MRVCCGLKLGASLLVLIGITVLLAVLEDKYETYAPGSFIWASMPWATQRMGDEFPEHNGGIIVVPAMDHDDVSWIAEELPEWDSAIYYVEHSDDGNQTERLTPPANKGNEAMAYLSYIIDHYGHIPRVVAFLHSHRGGFFRAWHTDTPLHDNVNAMQNLQLDHVLNSGYVNLRCNYNPGCTKSRKGNAHLTEQIWWEIFDNTSTPYFNPDANAPAAGSVISSSTIHLGDGRLPIWSPCCAQFAVSAWQIYQRPVEDYIKIREWILKTQLDNAHSGRVMEYLWHVIFGKEAVHCPEPQQCYCDVYGRC